jgi:hypothetical protein
MAVASVAVGTGVLRGYLSVRQVPARVRADLEATRLQALCITLYVCFWRTLIPAIPCLIAADFVGAGVARSWLYEVFVAPSVFFGVLGVVFEAGGALQVLLFRRGPEGFAMRVAVFMALRYVLPQPKARATGL